jgi:hypothetical protein
MEPERKSAPGNWCTKPSPAVSKTAHVADSQRSSDSLFKNKRSRKIAKGDGFLRFGRPSCETRLTSTPNTAAPSSERSAKGYGRRSKKIENYRRSSKCKSNDCAKQKARRRRSQTLLGRGRASPDKQLVAARHAPPILAVTSPTSPPGTGTRTCNSLKTLEINRHAMGVFRTSP